MAKDRTFRVSVMNIVIHPHTAQKYADLWRMAYRSRKPVYLRGKFKGLIGSHHPINADNPLDGIQGEIYKFFDLDPDSPWFDLESAKKADQEDVNQIKIPAKLKPELVLFNYVFFPKVHKLIYESKTTAGKGLSPGSMESMLNNLFSNSRIQEEFGTVEVTAVPRRNSLQTLFKIHRLSSLMIDLRKPNADDFAKLERRFMKRLEDMKARQLREIVVAERGKHLEPDDEVKQLAEVAKSNGEVIAHGADVNGMPVVKSTKAMPMIEAVSYDPDNSDARSAILQKANEIIND